jgi:predicted amidohydrolase
VRSIPADIKAFHGQQQIRLILVQVRSPFEGRPAELELQEDVRGTRFSWKHSRHVDLRIAKARATLAQLKAHNYFGADVTIVAFPEYSLPKQFHKDLQAFVDENNCVLIPGSYYEDDPNDELHRHNVCVIYQPGGDPIRIAKKHGFRAEQKALADTDLLPNVVHLRGSNEAIGSFSVSVFICRDYLAPFGVVDTRHMSLLDMDAPGINLVVMCSSQMTLFEGRAALDLRGVAGPRRLVALCNCAGTGIEGQMVSGSAILGPRDEFVAANGDVIEALKGEGEGIIVADVRLDNREFARIELKPDKTVTVPVRNCHRISTTYREDGAGAIEVSFRTEKDSSAAERGVWHPAFLECIDRKIVIHLLTMKRTRAVQSALENDEIRHVSAMVVEGKHDLLLRYYMTGGSSRKSFLDTNYTKLSQPRFDEYFDADKEALIVVEPRDMIKYRTVPIESSNNAAGKRAWSERSQKIRKLIPPYFSHGRRRRILRLASKLSKNWHDPNVSEADKRELAPIFFEAQEAAFATHAYERGTDPRRQKFILIALEASSKRHEFETKIIEQMLMPLAEVRSIYRIAAEVDGQKFDYWVDVVAPPWRIAEIVIGIGSAANDIEVEAGTRTTEVLKYYLGDSVEGVHATDFGSEIRLFLEETRNVNPELANDWLPNEDERDRTYEILSSCSKAWYEQTETIAGESASAELVSNQAKRFYAFFFWGNVARRELRDDYLRQAGAAWNGIYQHMEKRFKEIVAAYVVPQSGEDLWGAARRRLAELKIDDTEIRAIRTQPLQQVFHFSRKDPSFPFLKGGDLTKTINAVKDGITPFRNDTAHADQRIELLTVAHTPPGDKWSRERIIQVTADLIDLANLAEDCLAKLRASP